MISAGGVSSGYDDREEITDLDGEHIELAEAIDRRLVDATYPDFPRHALRKHRLTTRDG